MLPFDISLILHISLTLTGHAVNGYSYRTFDLLQERSFFRPLIEFRKLLAYLVPDFKQHLYVDGLALLLGLDIDC